MLWGAQWGCHPDFPVGKGAGIVECHQWFPKSLAAKERCIFFRGLQTTAPASSSVPGGRASLGDPPGIFVPVHFPVDELV